MILKVFRRVEIVSILMIFAIIFTFGAIAHKDNLATNDRITELEDLMASAPVTTGNVETSITTDNHLIITTETGDVIQFKHSKTPVNITHPLPSDTVVTYKLHPDGITDHNILLSIGTLQ